MSNDEIDRVKQDIDRQRHRQRVTNAYHRVFATEEGKAVLADLKHFFQTDAAVFIIGQTPYDAAIRDGQRQVIIRINEQLAKEVDADGDISKPINKIKK